MNTNGKLDGLSGKIRRLQHGFLDEIRGPERESSFGVRGRKIHFQEGIVDDHDEHRVLAKRLAHYWRDARWSSYITTPAILSCIIPAALMDLWASAYQFICFPAYGIPKVRRRDYIILDRSKLTYLNSIERLNCAYCGYVNGAIAYVQEIAARTEQHWCPIKHAFRLKTMHSRYQHFLDYGDARQYRKKVEEIRRDFDDLKKNSKALMPNHALASSKSAILCDQLFRELR